MSRAPGSRRLDGTSTLVTGAAGKTGLAVLRALLARGSPVRAFVHRPRHRSSIQELGAVEVVEGDLRNPEAVAAAVGEAGSVYHICPNVHPDEVTIGRNVIEAARRAGVERVVFHSVIHPQIEAMPHHWAKLRVEELLFDSGIACTILQPAPYMQNVLGQWTAIAEHGRYPVPYSLASRIAMVDLDDVAEAAARVLTEPGHAGATYELCGPDRPDQRQLAEALGRALGRPVHAEALGIEAWAEQAAAAGMAPYPLQALVAMFRYYERFGLAGNPRVLAWLLGRSPTTFAEFARRLAATRRG